MLATKTFLALLACSCSSFTSGAGLDELSAFLTLVAPPCFAFCCTFGGLVDRRVSPVDEASVPHHVTLTQVRYGPFLLSASFAVHGPEPFFGSELL